MYIVLSCIIKYCSFLKLVCFERVFFGFGFFWGVFRKMCGISLVILYFGQLKTSIKTMFKVPQIVINLSILFVLHMKTHTHTEDKV